jgi:hypothetical protein
MKRYILSRPNTDEENEKQPTHLKFRLLSSNLWRLDWHFENFFWRFIWSTDFKDVVVHEIDRCRVILHVNNLSLFLECKIRACSNFDNIKPNTEISISLPVGSKTTEYAQVSKHRMTWRYWHKKERKPHIDNINAYFFSLCPKEMAILSWFRIDFVRPLIVCPTRKLEWTSLINVLCHLGL